MASEGSLERSGRYVAAIKSFEDEVDSMMYPISREGLRGVTKNLLLRMFEYTPQEAQARTDMLDESKNIPTEADLDLDVQAGADLLKVGLIDVLAEDYLLQFGEEEFQEWVEPFLRSMLRGHITDSSSYEHEHECPDEDDRHGYLKRFCPAIVTKRFMRGELCEGGTPVAKNIGYLSHPEKMVYHNVTIIRTLQKLGIYSESETTTLLDKYMDWLESEEEPLSYDAGLFDN